LNVGIGRSFSLGDGRRADVLSKRTRNKLGNVKMGFGLGWKAILFSVVLYGLETLSLTFIEGHVLKVSDNKVARRGNMYPRETNEQDTGEHYRARNFIIRNLHSIMLEE
jgi:hypothetical protein